VPESYMKIRKSILPTGDAIPGYQNIIMTSIFNYQTWAVAVQVKLNYTKFQIMTA
jgi:hypothetical protein